MAFFRSLFSVAEQPSVIAKLAAMPPPANMEELEAAFKDYKDLDWVDLRGYQGKWVWMPHLFGLWRLQRLEEFDQKAVESAKTCFENFDLLTEMHKDLQGRPAGKNQLTHNQSVELAQYVILAGMPWHQIQQRGLHTNPIVQEFLQKHEADNSEWPQQLFTLFGPESKGMELLPEQWAKLEQFLWRNIALVIQTDEGPRYATWMDLLEEWAKGGEGRAILLANLKAHFKLVSCSRLFTDVFPPRAPAASSVHAPSPVRSYAPSRHGRGGSRIGDGSGRNRSASQTSPAPERPVPALNPNCFSMSDPRTGVTISLGDWESLRQFLVDTLLAQVKDIPWIFADKLKAALMADSSMTLERRCLSVQLFLEEFQALLKSLSFDKMSATSAQTQKMLGSFFALNDPLHPCLANSIIAALVRKRIDASPYLLRDQWLKPFAAACKSMRAEEREELFACSQQIPLALPGRKPAASSDLDDDVGRLLSYDFDPYGTCMILMHFLNGKQPSQSLNRRQQLNLLADLEQFLGMPLPDEMSASIFLGAPIPVNASTAFTAFHSSWRPEILRSSLFLSDNAVKITLPAAMAHWTDYLVAPQAANTWLDCRMRLVETLVLATFRDSPGYLSSLMQFKGIPNPVVQNEQGVDIPVLAPGSYMPPEGTLIPFSIKLKNYRELARSLASATILGDASESANLSEVKLDGAAFGRHVHFCSAWRYQESIQGGRKLTTGTLCCGLLLSLQILKGRFFEVTLPISLEVFSENPDLVDLFKLFMHRLTDEHYIQGQEEEMDEDAHLRPGDSQQQKIGKILRALKKLNLEKLEQQICAYKTTDAREQHLIALFEFFLELKVKYRQAGYAFVDMAKLPAHQRYKTTFKYGHINPLEDRTGWTILPLDDEKAKKAAYRVLWQDIDQTVGQIYLEASKPKPQPIQWPMCIEHKESELTLSVVITQEIRSYEGGKVVALTAAAPLPAGQGMLISTTPYCYPLGCKEHDAKQVIALLLCEMKRIYYKQSF